MDVRKELEQELEGLGEGSDLSGSSLFANVPLWWEVLLVEEAVQH